MSISRGRGVVIAFGIAALGVWIFNVTTLATLWLGSGSKSPASLVKSKNVEGFDLLIDNANTAIAAFPQRKDVVFIAPVHAPFQPLSALTEPSTELAKALPSSKRVPLVLKGVLLKKQPLALLADPTGKTWIVGLTEKVFEQEVTAIGSDKISLRDRFGSFDLSVKE